MYPYFERFDHTADFTSLAEVSKVERIVHNPVDLVVEAGLGEGFGACDAWPVNKESKDMRQVFGTSN